MAKTFQSLPRIDLRGGGTGEARAAWARRCGRSAGIAGKAHTAAASIIQRVREHGDRAIAELTAQFEGRQVEPGRFEVDVEARAAASKRVAPDVRAALQLAVDNVRAFHETQLQRTTGLERDGVTLRSRVDPLRRVALYVPGGTAMYPSSVVMTGVPARVAGVSELVMLTPGPSDVVLLAADLVGIDRVFAIGGAQAIAAVALGTESVPRVDKIVGPGNAFVTAAKRQVYGLCDIDGIAGPSEILIAADASAAPEMIAADLISQAEHDELACPVLVTSAPQLLDVIDTALREQLRDLPRAAIASTSLVDQGAAVVVSDRNGLVAEANAYAPEHLALLVERPADMAAQIRSAGAVFVGPWTPEAAGDYTAGPSHVLPTAGAARFGSPLGVWDFVKFTSVLELGPEALRAQADAIATLARAEGLEGHARAVEIRTRSKD